MRRALLLACGQYKDSAFTALRYPLQDAERMRALLEDRELCGFDEVRMLINPTKPEAHRAIEGLTSESTQEDFILLYFSGHGKLASDGSLAMVLSDTEERYLGSTGLLDDNLRSLFNAGRARQKMIVLDCCHAGAAGDEGFKRAAGDAFEAMAHQVSGTFMLTASTKFQPAFECAELDGSALTACLLEGVRSGDAAVSGADALTLSQLGEYLQREVPKRSNQQPKFWDSGGVGAATFAKVARRYDAPWREGVGATLRRMLAEEAIDEELFDEVRAALRAPADPALRPRLQLIDDLAQGRIRPLPFERRWNRLTAAPPPVARGAARSEPKPSGSSATGAARARARETREPEKQSSAARQEALGHKATAPPPPPAEAAPPLNEVFGSDARKFGLFGDAAATSPTSLAAMRPNPAWHLWLGIADLVVGAVTSAGNYGLAIPALLMLIATFVACFTYARSIVAKGVTGFLIVASVLAVFEEWNTMDLFTMIAGTLVLWGGGLMYVRATVKRPAAV